MTAASGPAAAAGDTTRRRTCELCGRTGPLGTQPVDADATAAFPLCGSCAAPAVTRRVGFQKVCDIVGYTGDADLWCPPCARLAYDRRIDGILRTIRQGDAVDYEGNPVMPVFRDDVHGDDHCGRCRERLDDVDRDP